MHRCTQCISSRQEQVRYYSVVSPDLRNQLKRRIELSGISIRKVALISGVNAGQLSRALRSEEKSLLSVDALERLAEAIGARLILMDQTPATDLISLLGEVPEKSQQLADVVRKLMTLKRQDLDIVLSLAERLEEKK